MGLAGRGSEAATLQFALRGNRVLRSCADPTALQKICDGLGPGGSEELLLALVALAALLPSAFTPADRLSEALEHNRQGCSPS